MSNAIFPDLQGLKWDIEKTPIWSTIIQTSANGKETRATNWSYPRYKFDLSFEFLEDSSSQIDDIHTIIGFYNARKGAYDDFLFKDDTDYQMTGQNIGSGNGQSTIFQIVRNYGGFLEPVKGVKSSTLKVYLDGVLTTDYTLSDYGVITFNSAPANTVAITVDCEFYYRVRFNDDDVTFNNFLKNLWECNNITLIKVK
jgi:uncharacterized protein (TIGR02217 family)